MPSDSQLKHAHHHPVHSFNLAFAASITLTLTYILLEVVYALKGNSMSLLADAAHNLGDSLGLILSWIANWLLSFPGRKRYSYGFKRISILAALANAFILVITSTLIAYEAVYKLFHPSAVNENIVILVGLIGIVVNTGCSLLFMRGAHHDLNIKSVFLHLMADALILGGVVVSAIIIKYTQFQWLDPAIGFIIVLIILWGTWGLLRDSAYLILDAVPRYIDLAGVKEFLNRYPGVEAIHDLHIWGLSTRETALTVHLVVSPGITLTQAHYQEINKILCDQFKINHATIQVETGVSSIGQCSNSC